MRTSHQVVCYDCQPVGKSWLTPAPLSIKKKKIYDGDKLYLLNFQMPAIGEWLDEILRTGVHFKGDLKKIKKKI